MWNGKNRMQRKHKRLRAIAACLLMMLIAVGTTVISGFARETDNIMPVLDPDQKYSLKIKMTYTDPDDEKTKVMPQVKVKTVKVADLVMDMNSANYVLTERFASSGVKLAGITVSESNQAAAVLAEMVDESQVQTGTTGEDGTVLFADIDPGMYLVMQDKLANGAYGVEAVAPMLLAVPLPVISSGGNSWQFDVEATPKTELMGSKKNGSILVTKKLFDISTSLAYFPPMDTDLVFYVGLFADEACTIRVAGTRDEKLAFRNGGRAEARFENLPVDRKYYIAETDGNGNVVSSYVIERVEFTTMYPEGQMVEITSDDRDAEIEFYNATPELPSGYYYGGTLTITKKTKKDGKEYPTKDEFYAGIFKDKACTQRAGEVVKLTLDNVSEYSVPVDVYIGTSVKDKVIYYITETDQNGNPLENDGSLDFTFTLDRQDGKVTLNVEEAEQEVVITNDFSEEEMSTETEEPETEESETEGEKTDTPSPSTGDETPVPGLMIMMAAALAVFFGGIFLRRKV